MSSYFKFPWSSSRRILHLPTTLRARQAPCLSLLYDATTHRLSPLRLIFLLLLFLSTLIILCNLIFLSSSNTERSTTSSIARKAQAIDSIREKDIDVLHDTADVHPPAIPLGEQPPASLNLPPSPHSRQSPPSVSPLTVLWQEKARNKCERHFGNGFDQQISFCTNSAATSPTSSTLDCYYNRHTYSTICPVKNIGIDTDKISVSQGDEEIESVRFREEIAEFPSYSIGAVNLECQSNDQPLNPDLLVHHLRLVFQSLQYTLPTTVSNTNINCDVTITTPTLFITRYEYANLYHTLTDLYNAYQALQMYIPPSLHDNVNVLFLDGHSKGSMDAFWSHLFTGEIQYIKHLRQKYNTNKICFSQGVFVSPGYGSALSPSMFSSTTRECKGNILLSDFSRWVMQSFGLMNEKGQYITLNSSTTFTDALGNTATLPSTITSPPLISFVVRRPYLSHPRVNMAATERRLYNEAEILNSLTKSFQTYNMTFIAWDFTQMTLYQQLLIMSHTKALIGLHGAALSYVLFLPPSSVLFEGMPAGFNSRQHFEYFALWSGHSYHAMSIGENGEVSVPTVVRGVLELLKKDWK